MEEMDEASGDFEDSSMGIEGSSCTSDSLHAEKGEISSTSGIRKMEITINGNQNTSDKLSRHPMVHGWSSDFSVDNKLYSLYDENTKLRGCLEIAESSILEMTTEVNSLKLVASELGIEMQRLTHELTSELASGEAIFEEVSGLRSECSKVKDEMEVLRHYKRMLHLNGRRAENLYNPDAFHGMKEWTDKPESHSLYLDGLMLLDKKFNHLFCKLQARCHEKDIDLISDSESIDFVLQNLKQRFVLSLSSSSTQEAGMKQISLQTLLDQELENKKIMNERICDLQTELEQSKSEMENLKRKMNQKVLHYDAFILELEERNLQTLGELESVKSANCSSLSTISTLQSEIDKMTCSMNETFAILSEEKRLLESVNKKLEKRVVASKDMLKRIRSTYLTTIDQLQKDLELLSAQVLSLFETNENLAKKALEEVPKLLYRDNHKFLEVSDKSNILESHQEPCQIFNAEKLRNAEIPRKEESMEADELHELYALNLSLNVIVEILKEILLDKNHLERDMKEKMDGIFKSEGLLMHKLEGAFEEIRVLQESVTQLTAKSDFLLADKIILVSKLQDACDENSILNRNLSEFERLITEFTISERIHVDEKSALENSLKEESMQKNCLKTELDKKSSSLNNLEKKFDHLGERLRIIYSNVDTYCSQLNRGNFQYSRVSFSLEKELQKRDYLAVVSQLDELQQVAFKEVLELNEKMIQIEKENISLKVLNEETASQLEDVRSKLDQSSSLVGKLQLELQAKAESEEKLIDRNKDLISKITIMDYKLQDAYSEIGDISKIREELEVAQLKIANHEVEKETMMDQLKKEHTKLNAQLNCCNDDLKSQRDTNSKLEETLRNLEAEKSSLESLLWHHEKLQGSQDDELLSLQNKVTENLRELSALNGTLRSRNDDLRDEKLLRLKMEDQIKDLMSKLLTFDELNAELDHCRQQIISLETSQSADEKLEAHILTLQSKVVYLDTELCKARERVGCIRSELHSEKEMREKLEATISDLTSLLTERQEQVLNLSNQKNELNNLMQQIVALESEKAAIEKLLTKSEEKVSELGTEISSLHSQLQSERNIRLNELTLFQQQVLQLEKIREEREREVSELKSLLNEKEHLLMSFKDREAELTSLRQNISEMESEKGIRVNELTLFQQQVLDLETVNEEREKLILELKSLLNEKEQQLLSFEEKEAELTALRQKVSEVESEKETRVKLESMLSEVSSLLDEKQHQLILLREAISEAKSENSELGNKVSHLHSQLQSERDIGMKKLTHLRQQVLDLETVKKEKEREVSEFASLLREKEKQLIFLKDREAELTALRQKVSEMESEREMRLKLETMLSEVSHLLDEKQQQLTLLREEISNAKSENSELGEVQLKDTLPKVNKGIDSFQKETELSKLPLQFEEEMEILRSSKEEHEIIGIILQSKLFEQHEQNQKLMNRLLDQILKSEEFKNLSIHFKNHVELMRKSESPPGAVMESLRVAFIKEQCEIRVQELQIQLKISKKHGEDLLLKLQSALDEIELRKKNEASYARRHEELSLKIMELESTKWELIKAFDEIRAELDCSIISGECCKEEKSMVEASLSECNLEIEKLRDELQSVKRQLDSSNLKYLEEISSLRNDHWVSTIGFKENSSENQRREQQDLRDGIKHLKQEVLIYLCDDTSM